jgi:PKD repeat protein
VSFFKSIGTMDNKIFSVAKASVILIFSFLFFANNLFSQTSSFTISNPVSCAPNNGVNFTDTSVGATTWFWDLGNSNTSVLQNPSASYPEAGVYTISLTINKGLSGENTSSQTITVYPVPNPTINFIVGCEPYSGQLIVDATPVVQPPKGGVGGITGGAPVSYTFNFAGALPTVTQASPILNLTNVPAGTYDVYITVVDANGCPKNSLGKMFKKAMLINPKPVANFTSNKSYSLCARRC